MERRYIDQQRANVRMEPMEGGGAKILGVASVFYDGTPATEYVLWDDEQGRAVERIMPGAFDAVIAATPDVRGLFNHDPDNILGRTASGTMRLVVGAAGLNYEIDTGATTVAHDVLEHLRRGDVSGSSFSFAIPPGGQTWTKTIDEGKIHEIREIVRIDPLYDVGPVTFPAYVATVAVARADADEIMVLRAQRHAIEQVTDNRTVQSPLLDAMRLELAESVARAEKESKQFP